MLYFVGNVYWHFEGNTRDGFWRIYYYLNLTVKVVKSDFCIQKLEAEDILTEECVVNSGP